MPTTLDDHPSLPLPAARHQQVRSLLVREARPAPVRRWVVPVAVAASVALVVAGTQLLDGDQGVDASTAPTQVDCALGIVPGQIADVPDAWRLVPSDAGQLVPSHSVRLEPTTCAGQPAGEPSDRPVQVLVAARADGTVSAAVTLWADAPARSSGSTAVTVRGVQGALQVGTEEWGTERVWWTEQGQERSLSASGLDRASVLALVELVGPDGTVPTAAYPAGMTALTWEEPGALQPYEPEWSASYTVSGTDVDPQVEPKGIGVSVSRLRAPWQTELSLGWIGRIPPRLVDVAGDPGVLFSNGGPDLWLTYSLGDGVQAHVAGVGDGLTGGALAFAGSLVPVAADDPRVVPFDWAAAQTSTP